MLNLKVGSIVYHKGVKRQVTRIVRAFDENFLILEGFPFIVRSGSVKPVFRFLAIPPETPLKVYNELIFPIIDEKYIRGLQNV